MWRWIAEVVEAIVDVAKARQAELHVDLVCTSPSVDLVVLLHVEVDESKAHTAELRSDGGHRQRHPCEVARAVTQGRTSTFHGESEFERFEFEFEFVKRLLEESEAQGATVEVLKHKVHEELAQHKKLEERLATLRASWR